MPFPVTNPWRAPVNSGNDWGDIRWNINNQIDLIAKFYDKAEIDEMLSHIWGSGKMIVVPVLPATWEDWFIYLVSHDGTGNPPFDMYIWTEDDTFQLIWNTNVDLSNYYTKAESDTRYQRKLIAGEHIDLNDLTNEISADLSDYYTQQEVQDLIDAIDTVKMQRVESLPTTWIQNIIYLLPTADPDVYEQWIWEVDTSVTPAVWSWKLVWTMEIDLSDYYTKTESDDRFLQIVDEKVLVYPFPVIGDDITEIVEMLQDGKAIILSTYDENDPDNAIFWLIKEYTDTQIFVDKPTQKEIYTFDANNEVTSISVDSEQPLYRRDYRWTDSTDDKIRNSFSQNKEYSTDTTLILDDVIGAYASWMPYKLVVTNSDTTNPITLTLGTDIENPKDFDLVIWPEEKVSYMLIREWNKLNIRWASNELDKYYTKTQVNDLLDEKQDKLTDGAGITGDLTDNQRLSVVNLTGKVIDWITTSSLWNYIKSKITGAISWVITNNLTVSRAVQSDSNGKLSVSATTATELGYVRGVTSAIQTQLDSKIDTAGTGLTKDGTTLKHSNSVTANTTNWLKYFQYDAQGHITSWTNKTLGRGIDDQSNVIWHSNTAITAKTTEAIYPTKIDAYWHVTSAWTWQAITDQFRSAAANQILNRTGANTMWKACWKMVGIFTRRITQSLTTDTMNNINLTASNDTDSSYVSLTSNACRIAKTGIYRIDITARLQDSVTNTSAYKHWNVSVTNSNDGNEWGCWISTYMRHKITTTFYVYYTANTLIKPMIYPVKIGAITWSTDILSYVTMVVTCVKES